jgi:adenosylhomocysteine nucleosidase
MITFLCALPQEAKYLRRVQSVQSGQATLFVTGVGSQNAERTARDLLSTSKPSLVISTGVAGALSPTLHIGDVVIAKEVIEERTGTHFACAVPSSIQHPASSIVSASRMISSAQDKAALASRFAAVAVDMESAAIARVCAEHSVPYAAIRAISDTADESLPPAVVRFFDMDGRLRYGAVVGAILREPSLIGKLRRLQQHTETACVALKEFLVTNPPTV